MADDNDHGGPSPDVPTAELVLGQLIDRHNDLVQTWEDNDDPNMRSQISSEIKRLDTQINDLTEFHSMDEQPYPAEADPQESHVGRSDSGNSEADYQESEFPESEFPESGYQESEYGESGLETNPHEVSEIPAGYDIPAEGYPTTRFTEQQLGAVGGLDRAGAAEDSPQAYLHNGTVGHNELAPSQFDQSSASPPPDDAEQNYIAPEYWAAPIETPYEGEADQRTEPEPAQPEPGRYEFHPEGESAGSARHQPLRSTGGSIAGSRAGNGTGGGDGQFVRPSGPVLAVVGVSLALLAGVLWFGRSDEPNETIAESATTVVADPAAPSVTVESEAVISNVRAVLDGLGLSGVVVDERNGTIHIGGPVPSQVEYDAAATSSRAVAGSFPIDLSALVVLGEPTGQAAEAPAAAGRSEALQLELNRLLAANPLIFASGQATLTELHKRILNNALLVLTAYPGLEVTVTGFTDERGDDASNQGLSLARAENVKAYLVSQGIPAESLQVKAIGEQATSGSEALARLERRVEFEVTGSAAAPQGSFRVGIVAPSASNDLAFTQSMVDAVNLLATEMDIELAVTDNTFVPDEAAAAVRGYADQGFDLVIAHGSQFGATLIDIAPQYPETAFAWGTASDTFGLPNVYAYDAAAQEGGYVLGALASVLSTTKVAGVVGPIELGDAAQYITGFDAGARAENPGTNVLISYTGSFSDIALATETAQAHIGAGADVLTGSAQMVVGAISAADQQGALWFGTQSNQRSLAPASVVASQVYHWEVALRPILNDISNGTLAGTTHTANLANGGLVIEFNPDFPLSEEARQRSEDLAAAIAGGSVVPPR